MLCNATIQGKHYRALATKANDEKYGALLQTMGMCSQGKACYICVNKLNKIVNLKGDILAKQQKCQSDVDAIFSKLQKLPGVVNSVAPVTPINIQKGIKRQRTPQTPKLTPKTKRPLFTTPPKLEIYSKREARVPTTIPTTSQGTQTTSCAEEFDVKVIQVIFEVFKLSPLLQSTIKLCHFYHMISPGTFLTRQ